MEMKQAAVSVAEQSPAPSLGGNSFVKTDDELKEAGFTDSGIKRYRASVKGYFDELFTKSVALGDRDKADDAPREVTHEHVREAGVELARRGRELQTPVQVWCQVGEYIFTAAAGAAAGQLDKNWGVILFAVCVALGVILFVVRNNSRR